MNITDEQIKQNAEDIIPMNSVAENKKIKAFCIISLFVKIAASNMNIPIIIVNPKRKAEYLKMPNGL